MNTIDILFTIIFSVLLAFSYNKGYAIARGAFLPLVALISTNLIHQYYIDLNLFTMGGGETSAYNGFIFLSLSGFYLLANRFNWLGFTAFFGLALTNYLHAINIATSASANWFDLLFTPLSVAFYVLALIGWIDERYFLDTNRSIDSDVALCGGQRAKTI